MTLHKDRDVQQCIADRSLRIRGLSHLCGANNSDTKTTVTLK
jgi:hypothetical protein